MGYSRRKGGLKSAQNDSSQAGDLAAGGSYLAMVSPDERDFSLIVRLPLQIATLP